MQIDSSKIVFLDRDGVINRDSADYIKGWEEFAFLPGSLGALRRLHAEGYSVIVVTNQSAVGRRMISIGALESMHRRMRAAVEARGGMIADVFYCPHLPKEGCSCRKPRTGLIEQAMQKYALEPAAAVMVGDSTKDILCARRAGLGRVVLVRTGNGRRAESELAAMGVHPDHVAPDLMAAVEWVVGPHCAQCRRPAKPIAEP